LKLVSNNNKFLYIIIIPISQLLTLNVGTSNLCLSSTCCKYQSEVGYCNRNFMVFLHTYNKTPRWCLKKIYEYFLP